jgi:hypothetical protein
LIGSGGGISLYEPEPSYQQGVQSTGYRTTPDVSMVADPATGAWIADPYNLNPSDPFELVGGTSLSAPAWAGLIALINQGRVAAGKSILNSTGPTGAQQALYSLPQSDYNVISSGNNGYTAETGYNLVTGLGTPVASTLVPDLVAYAGPGTTYPGPTVGPLQDATLNTTGLDGSGEIDVFSVFDALMESGGHVGPPKHGTPAVGQADATDLRERGDAHAGVPANNPAAPVSATGAAGMTPLADVVAAHDAALTGWSSPRSGSPRRVTVRAYDATGPTVNARTSPMPGRARSAVFQGTVVDSALEGLGALPSLLDADASGVRRTHAGVRRPIA